jgi:hypothetical protein
MWAVNIVRDNRKRASMVAPQQSPPPLHRSSTIVADLARVSNALQNLTAKIMRSRPLVFAATRVSSLLCTPGRHFYIAPTRRSGAQVIPEIAKERCRSLEFKSKCECLERIEPGGPIAVPRMTGIGASRPLRRIPAIVSFLNPQPALSLVGGNRSSCPFPALRPRA